MDAPQHVLDQLQLGLTYDFVDAGLVDYEKHGEMLPEETMEANSKHRIALKSPLTTPVGEGFSSINVELRKRFDLYANVSPAISFPNTKSRYEAIDLISFRGEQRFISRELYAVRCAAARLRLEDEREPFYGAQAPRDARRIERVDKGIRVRKQRPAVTNGPR